MTEQQLATAAFRSWKATMIVGGVTAIILGLVLLIWPKQTLLVFASLLGIGLILLGIARLANAAASRATAGRSRIWRAVTGLLYIIAGVVVLANLHGTLRFLVWAVGIIWVASGLVEIFSGIGRPRGERSVAIVIGLLNLAFGIILLVWPGPTVVFLVWISGLWLIALGLLQIIFAYLAGRAIRDGDDPAQNVIQEMR
jgi:uncharacterized membrane protein HdeD (DUF308 family)